MLDIYLIIVALAIAANCSLPDKCYFDTSVERSYILGNLNRGYTDKVEYLVSPGSYKTGSANFCCTSHFCTLSFVSKVLWITNGTLYFQSPKNYSTTSGCSCLEPVSNYACGARNCTVRYERYPNTKYYLKDFSNTECTLVPHGIYNEVRIEKTRKFCEIQPESKLLRGTAPKCDSSLWFGNDVLVEFRHGTLTVTVYNGTIESLNLFGSGGTFNTVNMVGTLERKSLCGPEDKNGVVMVSVLKDNVQYPKTTICNEPYDICSERSCILCSNAWITYKCANGAEAVMIACFFIFSILICGFILMAGVLITYKFLSKCINCMPSKYRDRIRCCCAKLQPTDEFVELKSDQDFDIEITELSKFKQIEMYCNSTIHFSTDEQKARKAVKHLNKNRVEVQGDTLTLGNNEKSYRSKIAKNWLHFDKKWYTTFAIVLLFLPCVLCCQPFQAVSGSSQVCQGEISNQTCILSTTMLFQTPGVGSEVCMYFYDSNGDMISSMTVEFKDYKQVFKVAPSYYTTDYVKAYMTGHNCPAWTSTANRCDWAVCNPNGLQAVWGKYCCNNDNACQPVGDGKYYCSEGTEQFNALGCGMQMGNSVASIYGGVYVGYPIGDWMTVNEVSSSYHISTLKVTLNDQTGTREKTLDMPSAGSIEVFPGYSISRSSDSNEGDFELDTNYKVIESSGSYKLCQSYSINSPGHLMMGDVMYNKKRIRTYSQDWELKSQIDPAIGNNGRWDSMGWHFETWPTSASQSNTICEQFPVTRGSYVLNMIDKDTLSSRSNFPANINFFLTTNFKFQLYQLQKPDYLRYLDLSCSGFSGVYSSVEVFYKCVGLSGSIVSLASIQYSGSAIWESLSYLNCDDSQHKLTIMGTSEKTAASIKAGNVVQSMSCETPFITKINNASWTEKVIPNPKGDNSWDFDWPDMAFFDWFDGLADGFKIFLSVLFMVFLIIIIIIIVFLVLKLMCNIEFTKCFKKKETSKVEVEIELLDSATKNEK